MKRIAFLLISLLAAPAAACDYGQVQQLNGGDCYVQQQVQAYVAPVQQVQAYNVQAIALPQVAYVQAAYAAPQRVVVERQIVKRQRLQRQRVVVRRQRQVQVQVDAGY